jgi:hypothetical protein
MRERYEIQKMLFRLKMRTTSDLAQLLTAAFASLCGEGDVFALGYDLSFRWSFNLMKA